MVLNCFIELFDWLNDFKYSLTFGVGCIPEESNAIDKRI